MRDVEIERALEPVDQRRVSRREAVLQVVMPQILQDRFWRVTERLGGARFTASMNDSDFRARVERGEIAFREGYSFRVRLATVQHVGGAESMPPIGSSKFSRCSPPSSSSSIFSRGSG